MALRRCAQTFARTARREAGLKLNDKPCVMADLRFALLALCQGMPNAASMSSVTYCISGAVNSVCALQCRL